MVSVILYKNRKEEYIGFECNGHAGYADYGKDIVCSALSMLIINTINSIEQLTNTDMQVQADEKSGTIKVEFQNPIEQDAILLLDSMILGIQETKKQYGEKYVMISCKTITS